MIGKMEIAAEFKRSLGNAIRNARRHVGVSQEKLAEQAGVTRRFIQELENGRSDISLQTLFRLAHALDTTLVAICGQIELDLTDIVYPGKIK